MPLKISTTKPRKTRRKAQPVALQRVFIISLVRPLRRIVEIDCMIVVGEKRTWAENSYGERHLIGATAFYTMASAERAKRGALVKIVETRFLMMNARTSAMWFRSKQQLDMFDATGSFTPPKKAN